MKVLLDTCVWGGVKTQLQSYGHDVLWTGDLDSDPGDNEILAQAYAEQRVLVTLDKDFGELAIRMGHAHRGIIRLVNIAAREQATICQQVLATYHDELSSGAILTVESGRIRIRPSAKRTDE